MTPKHPSRPGTFSSSYLLCDLIFTEITMLQVQFCNPPLFLAENLIAKKLTLKHQSLFNVLYSMLT